MHLKAGYTREYIWFKESQQVQMHLKIHKSSNLHFKQSPLWTPKSWSGEKCDSFTDNYSQAADQYLFEVQVKELKMQQQLIAVDCKITLTQLAQWGDCPSAGGLRIQPPVPTVCTAKLPLKQGTKSLFAPEMMLFS